MQQALLPLHLVTVGVGIAWLVRLSKTVNSTAPKPKEAVEPGDAAAAEGTSDADLERSATQWLARSGGSQSPAFAEHATSSSYAELELLAEGDFVYLRSGGSVLTALMPTVRHLALQPLQLAKGKPGSAPTAPLEAISVWLVRRCKQEVMFELIGSHDRRHVLEADPSAPHGVALAGGSPGKRGRWLITSQGLASVRWPAHVLPLQVLAVQLLDARAVKSVRDGLGQKLAELGAKLRQEEMARSQAEDDKIKLGAELKHVRNMAESQIAELRAQLEAAVIARHAAEREVAALQGQRADEAVRAKMANARAAQAESEARLAGATVRRQEQQIQGLLAEHAEELRTLQQELQIAREANEGLKRAMKEQILSLQGALELRDARILELEEENDRMDTVLQVIQAQLGGGSFSVPDDRGSAGGGMGAAPEPADSGAAGAPVTDQPAAAATDDMGAGDADAGRREPTEELSLSTIVGAEQQTPTPPQEQQPALPPGPPVADEPPLWRSLLDLTGDLSVTALKESLAISRRTTVEDAPAPSVAREPQPSLPLQPAAGASAALSTASSCGAAAAAAVASSPVRSSVCGMVEGAAAWGSGGGMGDGGGGAAAEEGVEFVSAAARMSGQFRLSETTPLQEQLRRPQVPGSDGGDVGFPSASRSDRAGAGADAAARRGSSSGGLEVAAAVGAPRDRAAALSCAATALAAAASGSCSLAQLEYGMEATLTLDSLRRRMRQLEAERQRLELLRLSLEESLPWRAVGGASVGGGGDDPGVRARRVAACAARSCGGGGARGGENGVFMTVTEGEQLNTRKEQKQMTCGRHDQADLQRQPGDGQRDQLDNVSMQPAANSAAPGQRPGASPGCVRAATGAADMLMGHHQRTTDGGASTNSPVPSRRLASASTGGATVRTRDSALSPAGSPGWGTRIRCITEQLLSRSSRASSTRSSCEAPVHDLNSHGCSGDGKASRRVEADADADAGACAAAAEAAGDACLAVGTAGGGVEGAAAPAAPLSDEEEEEAAADGALPAPLAGSLAGAVFGAAAAPAGGRLRLPGLAVDCRPLAPRVEVPYGVYDSIDGLCNLGSTRALPTARGAGWQTARRVGGHSRQPSAGVVAAPEVPPLPMSLVVPAAPPAVVTPRNAALPACSPGRTPMFRHAGAAAAAAGGATPESVVMGVATPKSCASTAGGGDFGLLDDDALVHCDDQEPPPPAMMLLGPLDKLLGAAAAVAAAAATDVGSSRIGGRTLSAMEEDDEAY